MFQGTLKSFLVFTTSLPLNLCLCNIHIHSAPPRTGCNPCFIQTNIPYYQLNYQLHYLWSLALLSLEMLWEPPRFNLLMFRVSD